MRPRRTVDAAPSSCKAHGASLHGLLAHEVSPPMDRNNGSYLALGAAAALAAVAAIRQRKGGRPWHRALLGEAAPRSGGPLG